MSASPIEVTFNVMYEVWEPGIAPGAGPMANPLPSGLDFQAISWANYGPRTGIWSLLKVFDETSTKATFHCSGLTGENHPESVRAIAEGGHDIAAHGWAQNIVPAQQSLDAEQETFARTWETLSAAGGRSPSGWLSPRCTPSANTVRLIAEHNGSWFGDVFDTDLPYKIETTHGPVTSLPFTPDVNDLPLSVRYGRPPEALADDYHASIEARRQLGQESMLDVTVHAHIGARPRSLATLRRIIESALGDPDIEVRTKDEWALRWNDRLTRGEDRIEVSN